jgi:ribose transport system substrate-binding protein
MRLSSRGGVWLAGLGVLVMAAAGCSSASSSSSSAAVSPSAAAAVSSSASAAGSSPAAAGSGVPAAVTATLDKYLGVPLFTPPGPAVNVSTLRGKRVFVIPIEETPFTQAVEAGEKAAAQAAGVQLTFYPNQGEVSQWVQGMQTAIAQKPALIILDTSPDPRELQPQIAAAKAAGIPVLVTHFYDATSPQPPACVGCAAGVTAIVKAPISVAGGAEADWIIANSGGKADVLIVSLNGLLPAPGMVAAAQAQFKQYCPGCKVTTTAINLSQLGTAGAFGQVASALVQDPGITYVDPLFDASIPGTLAAIDAAGKSSQIKMVSFNGSSFALKDVASGTSPVAADVAEPDTWVGYANMDQAFRVMTGMKPVVETTPIRIFDSANIAQAGGGPNYSGGYGTAYITGFFKLWGLPSPT